MNKAIESEVLDILKWLAMAETHEGDDGEASFARMRDLHFAGTSALAVARTVFEMIYQEIFHLKDTAKGD